MSHNKKVALLAEWLKACLSFGWSKSDLDWLQDLWWKYDAWKYHR